MRLFRLCLSVTVLIAQFGAMPPAGAQTCVGDCNGDGTVTISELITGVNIALGSAVVGACAAVDRNRDGGASIDELIAAVTNALGGCPALPATATATATASLPPTATITATPPATASETATVTPTPTATVTLTPTPTTRPPLLAVQINPDRVAPGDTAIVSMTVTNDGARTLNGVVVRAVLPASGIASTDRGSISDGGTCNNFSCAPGQQASWTLGDLAPGAGRAVSLPLTVLTGQNAPADLTEIRTLVSATATGSVQVTGDVVAVVDRARALAVAIDANRDPIPPGGELRYRLTFANRGLTPLAGAALMIPIPPGTSFTSASDGGAPVGGVIEWPLGDLAAGASGVRDLAVQVDAVAGQVIAAEAALTGGGAEAHAQHLARVGDEEPLTVTLAAGPDPIGPGEPLLVSLTVTNRGNAMLPGVLASLRLPVGVAGVEPAAAGGPTCNQGVSFGCDPLERMRWTIGDLPPGQGVTFSLPATVLTGQTGPAPGTLLLFEGDAGSTDGRQAQARRNIAVRANRPLEVELDAGPQPAAPDGELRYRVSFGNRGVTPLASGVLAVPIPEGTTFHSASDGGVAVDGVVTWQLGDLAAGAGGVRELVVRVDAATPDGAPVAAQAKLDAGGAQARAQTVTRVEANAPLTLGVAVGPDPITPGEAYQVVLTATNRGLTDLFDVQAALRVPGESGGFATNLTTGGVVCNAGVSFGCDPLERAIWTIGSLPAGHGATLTLPAAVPSGQAAAPAGAILSFDADVKANNGERAETRRSILLRASRAPELEIHASPQIVGAGESLLYTLTFGNRGVAPLTGAVLELPIPTGTSFESVTGGGTVVDGVVSWALGDLAPGAGDVREVRLQVAGDAPQGAALVAGAVLRSAGGDAHAEALAQVRDALPITVDVTTSPDPVASSESMAVRVTVTNRGLVSLFDVHAGLRVPPEVAAWAPNLSSPNSTCSAGASFGCDPLERQVWTIGELKPGQGVTLSVPPVLPTGQGAPSPGSVITFEADAEANDGSQILARRSLPLRAARPLELEMDPQPNPVAAGATLTYALAFGNRGAGVLGNAQLELPLPAGVSFASASDGGMLVDGVVVWMLGDLNPGAGGARELMVSVDATAGEGSALVAEATLFAGGAAARANALARVQSGVPLSLAVTAIPNPAMPGQSVLLSATATNEGLLNLFGITASVRVPPEVAAFSGNLTGGGNCSRAASFGCDPLETVLWSLGTPAGLAPSASVAVSVPPVVAMGASAPPAGALISFEVDVRANDGSQAVARPSVRVQ